MTEPAETLLLGAHVSIAGGVEKAIARGEEVGCTAIQVFTGNASRWQVKPLTESGIQSFRDAFTQSTIQYVAAHDSYLINLASPDDQLRSRSVDAFVSEMERCSLLGIRDLVMHPGAHVGQGVDAGLRTLVDSFKCVLARAPADVRILIENTAGQGTSLGSAFEELAEIVRQLPSAGFGICLDTCHAFAAGYDLSSKQGYEQTMEQLDRLIGVDKVALFHINDSKKPLGSRVDRHEHVGQGHIGPEGFKLLMRDERFRKVAKIIETPGGEGHCHDLENLALLRSFYEQRRRGI